MKKKYQPKIKLTFMGVVLALFLVATIFLTIETSSASAILAKLETEEVKLLHQNQEIGDKLVKSSSLTEVNVSAENLGFAKPEKIIYLGDKEPVARLP